MAQEQVSIGLPDGECRAHVFKPAGTGPWPAVIFYMDAFGIRPALFPVGQRLADAGHIVLLPDMFYRFGPYDPLVPEELLNGDFMSVIRPMMASTDNRKAAQDTEGFIRYLDTREDVRGERVGAVGFCMGGGMAITAAGLIPERIAAVASFHAGNLATDALVSPHLLAAAIKAEVYVAGADNDPIYPPEMARRLEAALSAAGVKHRCEIYAGAAHGWMNPDFPVYEEHAAERGWENMLTLLKRTL